MSVSLSFARRPAPEPEDIARAMRDYTCEAQELGCHSAPKRAIVVTEEQDRPQPRLDRDVEGGQAVTVGRIRKCNVLDIKFTLLVHNTVLGAAGSSVLNAEVAIVKGLI